MCAGIVAFNPPESGFFLSFAFVSRVPLLRAVPGATECCYLAAALVLLPFGGGVSGQVTTASIRGSVRSIDGSPVEGARVRVVNTATGFAVETEVRHGRFVVHGLEVGGPYSLTAELPGMRAQRRDGVHLGLGEPVDFHIVMEPAAIPLDPLRVETPPPAARANADGGTATLVPDSLLHRLPTLNRNIYDFVRLSPQISTRIGFAAGGLSGGGTGFRFNDFRINGVSQRSVGGHVPPEFAGGRSVPFEAVSEYQLLIAPFDVRYGDFTGALVNAVTRSGTNQLSGSVFAYGRNDRLARRSGEGAGAQYERFQYGFTAGGPIVRDRVHFFIAPEFQHFTSPAAGPYLGQPATVAPAVPVAAAEVTRLEAIMRTHGLESGSGGPIENRNPLRNIFARLDASVPEWNSRAVLWLNDSRGRNLSFSRPPRDVFPLSTNRAVQASSGRTATLQLHTALGRAGMHSELLVSHRSAGGESRPPVRQPIVRVAVPGTGGGAVTLVTGTPIQAQGSSLGYSVTSIAEHLTVPLGRSHVVSLGFDVQRFRGDRSGVNNAYGTWDFASLDSLAAGVAEHFEVQRDFGTAGVPIRGTHYAAWIGDQWRAGERLALTFGIRADVAALRDHPPYAPVVDAVFGRRTDVLPGARAHLSPRLGFTWDVRGDGRDRVRGGMGVFTGRAPSAWLHAPLYSYGLGVGVLRCGRRPGDAGDVPQFVPDYRTPPAACGDGGGATAAAREVELVDPDLRMAQSLRTALAYDRRLAGDLRVAVEALVTRGISDFVFVNLNLEGPQGTDPHGRVLYGAIGPTGLATPALRSDFSQVIELRNTSRNRAYQLSARVEKPFSGSGSVVASYTFSRVRDVQTPLRIYASGALNWSSRAVSGRHDDPRAGISLNDIPHRVVLAATHRAPWRRWTTELSLFYVGESGSPFTYVAYGAGRRGDLNADGSNVNDPVYIPRSAGDPGEIRFAPTVLLVDRTVGGTDTIPVTAAEQADAFDQFIRRSGCLRSRRGRILERNACREPWSHTTIASIRQSVPIGNRALEAQLDVFNLLNLLRSDWGLYRVSDPGLLEHVGQSPDGSQPVFHFDPMTAPWTALPTESAYQLQLAVRYRF